MRVSAMISFTVALVCCLLWTFRVASPVAATAPTQIAADGSDLILVALTSDVDPAELSTLFEAQGFQLVEVWPAFELAAVRPLPVQAGRSAEALVTTAAALPYVRLAEADAVVEAAVVEDTPWLTPNDPMYPDQWALTHIGMETAWRVSRGSPSVVVAIIDSGVDVDHEDLSLSSVYPNAVELNGQPDVDDDGNGYIDDVYGWDWVEDDANPDDLYGHGTHVAGAMVATTNNELGVAGAAPNLRIMPLRMLDQRGSGYISDLIYALDYARTQGADIVNLSLVLRSDADTLHQAVKRLYAEGVLVITVTGNNGSRVYWPGAYTETVAVAAVDYDDLHASFSNPGPESDIAAPGDNVLSTYKDNAYREWQGTSFAAPYVAAAAGLIWSLRPDLPGQDVVDILLQTAEDVNAADYPGEDDYLGHGRLDVGAALMLASAGVNVDVQLPAGSYLSVGERLQLPVRLTVTDTQNAVLPVQGAVIDAQITSPRQRAADGVFAVLEDQQFYTDESGYVVGTLTLPAEPGIYTLSVSHGVQTREVLLDVKAAPLALSLTPEVADIEVGAGATAISVMARTQDGDLYTDDLLVTLRTDLGNFSDGSQSRTLIISGGRLTETLTPGTVAGTAHIELDVSGRKQQVAVLIKPGMPVRLEGPQSLYGYDFGKGATVEIALRIYDQYGNKVWTTYPVNFYSTDGFFSPASVQSADGEANASFTVGAWMQAPQPIWAMIPGTFAIYQADVQLLSNHSFLPTVRMD
ncbi:MAG: S8 family serine peptidase [Caldilineaceae bacterium]